MAIIPGVAKCQREFAVPWVIFVAFEIMFQANILCFAEAFKPGIGTPKPFGALHLTNDFVDLLSSGCGWAQGPTPTGLTAIMP